MSIYFLEYFGLLRITFGGKRRFFAPDIGNCEAVSRAQKNVAEQNTAEGEARTVFCGA